MIAESGGARVLVTVGTGAARHEDTRQVQPSAPFSGRCNVLDEDGSARISDRHYGALWSDWGI